MISKNQILMKTKPKKTREVSLKDRTFIQNILDFIPGRVLVLNQELTIVMVNQRWIDFGVENKIDIGIEWIGKDYADICQQSTGLSGSKAMEVYGGIRNIISGLQEEVTLEYSHHKKGKERWFSFHAKGFNHSKNTWVTISHTEITRQKKLAIAPSPSEERYRNLSKATFEAIFFSEDGVCLEQNQTAEKLFGLKLSEIIGKNGPAWVVAEDREMVLNNILSGYEGPYEAIGIRKDGSTFSAEIRGGTIFHKGREVCLTTVSDISKQKQVEIALRESEDRFHHLANASMEAIFFTKGGICLDTNQVAVKMFGFNERSEIIGMSVTELVTKQSQKSVRYNSMNNILEPYEAIGKRIDGTEFPISIRAKSMPYKDEGIVRVTSVMDITERKHAELELLESEEKYRSLFTSSNDAIFLMQNDRFITCNPKTLEMFACKEDEIIDHSPVLFSPEYQPDGRLSSEKALERINAALTGTPQFFEWIHQQKGGTLFDAEVSLNKMTLSDGEYIHATVRNITQRKQVEKALLESESKYRSLFERSADAILIIKEDRFVDCNKATVEMLGFTNKEELLNNHPSQLSTKFQADGRDSNEAANEMMAIAYQNGSHRFEWLHVRNTGEIFPVEVLLTSVNIEKGRFFHVVWRDITERKEAEESLINRNKELQIFYDAAVGRELKVLELKREINEMLEFSGEKAKYKIPV
ncbi:MAG: PAS domain-containing protein [Candidatus Heimdallarchaeota archaeon]